MAIADLSGRGVALFPDLAIEFDNEVKLGQSARDLASLIKPDWPQEALRHRKFSEGITNVLVGVYRANNKSDMVMVRCYGHHTDDMIDRQAEIRNMLAFHDAGCGPTLYATFANGVAYSFIPGTMLTPESIVKPQVSQMVLEMMAHMHHFEVPAKCRSPCLWRLLRQFLSLCPTKFDDPRKNERFQKLGIFTKDELTALVIEFEGLLCNADSPIVFCHNDLLLGNIILSHDQSQVRFIDYEYGDFNYQAFDIANHFAEYVGVENTMNYERYFPSEEMQKDWLKRYLKAFNKATSISSDVIHETYVLVNKFVLLSHLNWGLWALVQANISTIDFDYLLYAKQRFDELKRRKKAFLALK
eukprot:snap_masked-scaffold132_size323655-processed-gene-0.3 protein:Tk07899 transcript:snap_masked-scaffold132_size323655-processed-gene-0.3-mRNA-1 annotation:"low quality protein: ethanolamine kinase 1"